MSRAYQRCPSCNRPQDVSIFVTGQKVRCAYCGISFIVERSDVQPASQRQQERRQEREKTMTQHGLPAVSGFEVIELIGKGGMSEVYLAKQLSLSRKVVLKIIDRELMRDEALLRRFEREAGVLANLRHPGVVGIIDKGMAGGTPFFAMEYMGGASLRKRIDRREVKTADALRYMAQICDAISYAHERGVIHRDLKPSNILFDEHDNLKVADFGLAAVAQPISEGAITRTHAAIGTFDYMAPEQRNNAKDVDGRADIYSLGVILYEMLMGEPPRGHYRPPSQSVGDLGRKIDGIVERCLDTDPARRYQSASELKDAVNELLGSTNGRSRMSLGSPVKNIVVALLLAAALIALGAMLYRLLGA